MKTEPMESIAKAKTNVTGTRSLPTTYVAPDTHKALVNAIIGHSAFKTTPTILARVASHGEEVSFHWRYQREGQDTLNTDSFRITTIASKENDSLTVTSIIYHDRAAGKTYDLLHRAPPFSLSPEKHKAGLVRRLSAPVTGPDFESIRPTVKEALDEARASAALETSRAIEAVKRARANARASESCSGY